MAIQLMSKLHERRLDLVLLTAPEGTRKAALYKSWDGSSLSDSILTKSMHIAWVGHIIGFDFHTLQGVLSISYVH